MWLSDRPLQKKEQLCFPTKHTKVGRCFDWSLLHCSDKGGSPGSYTRTTLGFIHSLCKSVTTAIEACYTFCHLPHSKNIYTLADSLVYTEIWWQIYQLTFYRSERHFTVLTNSWQKMRRFDRRTLLLAGHNNWWMREMYECGCCIFEWVIVVRMLKFGHTCCLLSSAITSLILTSIIIAKLRFKTKVIA